MVTSGPAILLTFDDASATIRAEAFSYMRGYGLKATFYLIGQSVAAAHDDLYDFGWDMANHTQTHQRLDTLSQAEAETEISDCIDSLEARGFTRASHHLAYPGGYGETDETVLAAVAAQNIVTARTTLRSVDETIPLADVYAINCDINLGVPTTLAEAKAWVDDVITKAKIGLCFAHSFVAAPESSTEWAITDLQALIDYIVAKRVPTLTISELYTLHDTGTVTVRVPNALPP